MAKSPVCIVVGFLMVCAVRADIFTWTGKDGSLTGDWSDTACWKDGLKPDNTVTNSYIYLPKSATDYTVTLDEDANVTNCYLQVQGTGTTGGTITITGHGKKLTTRKAGGPSANSFCQSGMTLRFADIIVEMCGCNALGGEIVVASGATFTTGGSPLYCNTANSRFTVEAGADVTLSSVDNRGVTAFLDQRGGSLNVTGKLPLRKATQVTVSGGAFTASTVSFEAYVKSGVSSALPNGAKFEVSGGQAAIASLSFDATSTNSIFAVSGGDAEVSELALAAPNEIRVTGGTLFSPKPDKPAFANVTFTGGTWSLQKAPKQLLTYLDQPLLPQGTGVLNAQTDSSTFELAYGMSLLASALGNVGDPGIFLTNALFSGTIQVTNRNARTDFYTRGGDAQITVGNRGRLIVPVWSGRAKGSVSATLHQFNLDLFALTWGCHSASPALVNDFLNGVTIGANGDWNNKDVIKDDGTSSGGNISRFRFHDYVTFDTRDVFNQTDTHRIEIYKAIFGDVTNLTVRGGGAVTLAPLAENEKNDVGELNVLEGTELILPGSIEGGRTVTNTLDSTLVSAGKLSLESHAKLTLAAGRSSLATDEFAADETSEIAIDCPAQLTAGEMQTCFTTKTLGETPKLTLSGAHAGGWNLRNVAGCVYLDDGTTPELPSGSKPYTWSGAVSGNFSDAGNWFGGAAPSVTTASDNEFIFTGHRNMVITNDMHTGSAEYLSIFNLQFAEGCGPVEIRGNPLYVGPQGYSGANSAIYDESDSPVAIYCNLSRTGKFGLHNAGSSTLYIMGNLSLGSTSSDNVYTRGDVRLGGTVTIGNILYYPQVESENNLRILNGASVTLSRPDVVKQTNAGASYNVATLTVEAGGSFTTAADDVYDPGRAQLTHVVNGTASILGGLSPATRDQTFTGTGTLVCGASCPTTNTAARTVTMGGGLTFAPSGDWRTLTAANPDFPLTIRVEGELTVDPQADWTYGAAGVATATTAAERALVGAAGSTLAFAASEHATRLADPIVSEGAIVFETGAKLEPIGALRRAGAWTTVAEAASIEGLPASASGKFRIVDGDGCQLLQFWARGGFTIVIR